MFRVSWCCWSVDAADDHVENNMKKMYFVLGVHLRVNNVEKMYFVLVVCARPE